MPDRRPHRRRPEARRRLAALKPGEAIAALSAIALFVFMFFGWYGYEQTGNLLSYVALVGFDGDAWHSLEGVSWLLLLAILFALGTALLPVLDPDREPAAGPSAGVAALGGLATVLIALRIVYIPDFDKYAGLPVRFSVELGAYLGLVAAAGIAYGGYRSMRERGGSFARVADALSADQARAKRARQARARMKVKPKPAPKPK
ncbi:MAG TPA: hypothetical protein VMS11_04200 [Solirubrobacterales bacterium]|nr:hypothetical protein [Solirubrobacterales bacterium]